MIFMEMTVKDILARLTKIDDGIIIVEGRMDSYGKQYPAQEPLYQVIELLEEYRELLLKTTVKM